MANKKIFDFFWLVDWSYLCAPELFLGNTYFDGFFSFVFSFIGRNHYNHFIKFPEAWYSLELVINTHTQHSIVDKQNVFDEPNQTITHTEMTGIFLLV